MNIPKTIKEYYVCISLFVLRKWCCYVTPGPFVYASVSTALNINNKIWHLSSLHALRKIEDYIIILKDTNEYVDAYDKFLLSVMNIKWRVFHYACGRLRMDIRRLVNEFIVIVSVNVVSITFRTIFFTLISWRSPPIAAKPGQNQDSDFTYVNLPAQKIITRLNHGKSEMGKFWFIIGIFVRCTVFYFEKHVDITR